MDRHTGLVNGQLLKVGTSVTVQLGVQVGEETALEQRVIGEIDTTDDVAGLELNSWLAAYHGIFACYTDEGSIP